METESISEEQLKKELGIGGWRGLTKEKFFDYLTLSPQIDTQLHLQIIAQIPNLVTLIRTSSERLLHLSRQNEGIARKILEIIETLTTSLHALVQKEELTSEERWSVLDMLEIGYLAQQIDKENNGFVKRFRKARATVAARASLVIAAICRIKANQRVDELPSRQPQTLFTSCRPLTSGVTVCLPSKEAN